MINVVNTGIAEKFVKYSLFLLKIGYNRATDFERS